MKEVWVFYLWKPISWADHSLINDSGLKKKCLGVKSQEIVSSFKFTSQWYFLQYREGDFFSQESLF